MANSGETETNQYSVFNIDRAVNLADSVSVAGSSPLRKRGLLGVDTLQAGAGLWIAPCEAVHTFGMRMPIDVVFLDRAFRVRKLVSGLRPWRIAFALKACSVLELEAGAISRTETSIGDRLRFQAR